MEENDFQFDLAIQSALKSWLNINATLNEALDCRERFITFHNGILRIDLSCICSDYYAIWIKPKLNDYCVSLIETIYKPVCEFILLYDFPSITLRIEVHRKKVICTKHIIFKPEFMSTNQN